MKKLLIICILILSVIFISGCTSDEQASSEISTSSQSNQESDSQNPELIIKQSDVPGLTLGEYIFYAVPKNTAFTVNTFNQQVEVINFYTDTLELGYRNVGEDSTWQEQSGRSIRVSLMKYDSNTGLDAMYDMYDTMSKEELEEAFGPNIDFGLLNIGDYSSYTSVTDVNTGIKTTSLGFYYKNNAASVIVIDEKDESYKQAIRIAKLVKSRLD